MTFIWGIVIIVTGVLGLFFSQQIYNFTGKLDFVENRFPGYTLTFIKLTAILLTLIGIIVLSGTSKFITEPLGNFFRDIFSIQ